MSIINIGASATDRGSNIAPNNTVICKDSPANATGKITSVEIWCQVDLVNCVVATFYRPDPTGSPHNFTTRDSHEIGDVTAGSKQTFTVDINVTTGDYIGIHYTGGNLDYEHTGAEGLWYFNADYIPCTNETFTFVDNYSISLGGTGGTFSAPTVSSGIGCSCDLCEQIFYDTIVCCAEVEDDGECNITEVGFEYGETERDTWAVRKTGDNLGEGEHYLPIGPLKPSTEYHIRFFATNSEGTTYGDWGTCITKAAPSYGLYEEENSPTICFYISEDDGKTWGQKHGPYTEDQADIEVTKLLVRGSGKKKIKFTSDVLTGISASILVKLDCKAR